MTKLFHGDEFHCKYELESKKHSKKSTSWITIDLNQVTQIWIIKLLWASWEIFLVTMDQWEHGI